MSEKPPRRCAQQLAATPCQSRHAVRTIARSLVRILIKIDNACAGESRAVAALILLVGL